MKTIDTIEENVPEGLPVHYIETCLEDLRGALCAPVAECQAADLDRLCGLDDTAEHRLSRS